MFLETLYMWPTHRLMVLTCPTVEHLNLCMRLLQKCQVANVEEKMLTTTAKREPKHQKLQPENLAIAVVSNFCGFKDFLSWNCCFARTIPVKPQMTNNDKQIFMLNMLEEWQFMTIQGVCIVFTLAPSCLRTQTHHNAALLSWRCCDHLRFDDFLETIFKESLQFGQN